MMDKQFILSELKRVAAENGGTAPGSQRFAQETGIQRTDWLGKHWARWGDAVREAGLQPNKMNAALPEPLLLERYAELTAELGRIPTKEEIRLKARRVRGFPSHNTFERLGGKAQRLRKLAAYCREQGNRDDVLALCESAIVDPPPARDDRRDDELLGFVYLLKSGKFYKLGKTNCLGRRERDLAIQLPEKSKTVHAIRTDDPAGIEAYWHQRFEAKRMNGEWFDLSADDVRAFRRRKFM
jgi:hypothetical protein